MTAIYIFASIAVVGIAVAVLAGLICFTAIRKAVFPETERASAPPLCEPPATALTGHLFCDPRYFWAPTAASLASDREGAGAMRVELPATDTVTARIRALRQADPGNARPVPYDLITGAADILDPYISPAAANYQIARIARHRSLDEGQVRALVADATEGRVLGLLGEVRVDVLKLNLALDRS